MVKGCLKGLAALAALLVLLVLATRPRRGASEVPVRLAVDAARVTGRVEPLWGDHYDLSFEHLRHLDAPGVRELLARLAPRTLRCSVGRWEVGHPPPAGATSDDPAVAGRSEREFYRGADTLAAADDPANYSFAYLDRQLDQVRAAGFEPFVCFDHMPATLARRPPPGGPGDIARNRPEMSFSNGVRTAPPATPAVYARVVANTIRHLRGRFGEGPDRGLVWFEVGNEPDLVDLAGDPLGWFWTGTRAEFVSMYAAIAREVDADPALAGAISLGAASFGLPGTEARPGFLEDFVAGVAAAGVRLDFLSFHSYDDVPAAHAEAAARAAAALRDAGLDARLVNGEWGRNLEGRHAIYESVDFGLFRFRAMNLMQRAGVALAHEALLRDPVEASRIFGLMRMGATPTKPVAEVYASLARLGGLTVALATEGGCEGCLLAAADPTGARVTVAYADGGDFTGLSHPLALEVRGLGLAGGKVRVRRLELDDPRAAAGAGPLDLGAVELTGDPLVLTVPADPDGPRLLLWELAGTPTRAPHRVPTEAEVRAAFLADRAAHASRLAGLGPDEAIRQGRAALAAGDPDTGVPLLAAAFRTVTRDLDAAGGADPAGLAARLELQRVLMEELAPLYEARRQGHAAVDLARTRHATLAGLLGRGLAGPPRAAAFEAWLAIGTVLHRAYGTHASPAAAARLAARARELATRVFGAGSPEADRVATALR